MSSQPTRGRTSADCSFTPRGRREPDDDAQLRERAAMAFVAMFFGGLLGGLLVLIWLFDVLSGS